MLLIGHIDIFKLSRPYLAQDGSENNFWNMKVSKQLSIV